MPDILRILGGTLNSVIFVLINGLHISLPELANLLGPNVQQLLNCLAGALTNVLETVLGTLFALVSTLGIISPGLPLTVIQLLNTCNLLLGGGLVSLLGVI